LEEITGTENTAFSAGVSGLKLEFFHQPVGEGQDKVALLPGGVINARAAQGLLAAHQKFKAHEVVPYLYGKAERRAVPMFKLVGAEQVVAEVDPPDVGQTRGLGVLT